MPVLSTLKIVVCDLLGCFQILLFAVLLHPLAGNLHLDFSDGPSHSDLEDVIGFMA